MNVADIQDRLNHLYSMYVNNNASCSKDALKFEIGYGVMALLKTGGYVTFNTKQAKFCGIPIVINHSEPWVISVMQVLHTEEIKSEDPFKDANYIEVGEYKL